MVIYKTTNLINGKIYIGKDKHNNPNYFGSGKYLNDSMKHYGKEYFKKEILEYCDDIVQMGEREKFWIVELNSLYPNGYNLTLGGEGGDTFSNKNEIDKNVTREKLSRSTKNRYLKMSVEEIRKNLSHNGEFNPMFGRSVFEIWVETFGIDVAIAKRQYMLQKISVSLKNVVHTDEWNQKVSYNNSIRFHTKKIKFFQEQYAVSLDFFVEYFKIGIDKIIKSLNDEKFFDKEPNPDILLLCLKHYNEGIDIHNIRKIFPVSRKQIKTFIDITTKLKIYVN